MLSAGAPDVHPRQCRTGTSARRSRVCGWSCLAGNSPRAKGCDLTRQRCARELLDIGGCAGGQPAAIWPFAIPARWRGFVQHSYNATATDRCGPERMRELGLETHGASELDERRLALTRADDGLGSHNPKVAGSNPAPATNEIPGQRPFPSDRRGPLSVGARTPREQARTVRVRSEPWVAVLDRRFGARWCGGGSSHAAISQCEVPQPLRAPG